MTVNFPDDEESQYVVRSREEYHQERDIQFNLGGIIGVTITLVVLYCLGYIG